MHLLEVISRSIDSLTERIGKAFSWLIFVLILAITYDVIMRYVFSAPTIWSFDLSYMLGGTVMLIGLSYVHLKKSHVRVDIFSKCFSAKTQLTMNVLFKLIFFFPLVAVLIKISLVRAIYACQVHEVSKFGMWHPSMIPFKMIMLIAFVILALQGISQFVRELLTLARRSYD